MALRVVAPTFAGNGGTIRLGSALFSIPSGSQFQYYEDPATAWRVAIVRVPHPGTRHPWAVHVVCSRGEILGIPDRLLADAERQFFPST